MLLGKQVFFILINQGLNKVSDYIGKTGVDELLKFNMTQEHELLYKVHNLHLFKFLVCCLQFVWQLNFDGFSQKLGQYFGFDLIDQCSIALFFHQFSSSSQTFSYQRKKLVFYGIVCSPFEIFSNFLPFAPYFLK